MKPMLHATEKEKLNILPSHCSTWKIQYFYFPTSYDPAKINPAKMKNKRKMLDPVSMWKVHILPNSILTEKNEDPVKK